MRSIWRFLACWQESPDSFAASPSPARLNPGAPVEICIFSIRGSYDGIKFDDVIVNFQDEIEKLGSNPENESIRDYLAEMRAWILLYAAPKAPKGKMLKERLDNGLDNYAKTLKPADIEAIKTGKPTAGLGPLDMQIRRQMRAMEVFNRANEIVKDNKDQITGDDASLTFNPPVSELINVDGE